MEYIQSIFNNREVASAFWLITIGTFAVFKLKLFSNVWEIGQALFLSKLTLLFAGLAAWMAVGVWGLHWFGLWTISALKLTVFWYFFSGCAFLGNSIQNDAGSVFFKRVVRNQFTAIVAVEFVVVFYSFSLIAELLFVPFVTALALMIAFSETKPEFAPVKRLFEWIMVGVALLMAYHFVSQTWANTGSLFAWATVREIVMPIALSVFAIPFGYLVYCYARWEESRITLNQKTYHNEDLRMYGRRRFFWELFFRPVLLKRAARQFNMLPAKSKADVRAIIADVKAYEAQRSNPPVVPVHEGWSPYEAEKFLTDQDYATGDFHNSGFGDEWFAESQTRYLDDAGVFETLVYRAKGLEGRVHTLQIKGCFKIDPRPSAALDQMMAIVKMLVERSTSLDELPAELEQGFERMSSVSMRAEHHQFKLDFSMVDEANIMDVEFSCSVTS